MRKKRWKKWRMQRGRKGREQAEVHSRKTQNERNMQRRWLSLEHTWIQRTKKHRERRQQPWGCRRKKEKKTCKGNGCLEHKLNWCRPMLYWSCAHALLEVCTCSIGGVHMLNWSIHAPVIGFMRQCVYASTTGTVPGMLCQMTTISWLKIVEWVMRDPRNSWL